MIQSNTIRGKQFQRELVAIRNVNIVEYKTHMKLLSLTLHSYLADVWRKVVITSFDLERFQFPARSYGRGQQVDVLL
jgi:hypothetical protein